MKRAFLSGSILIMIFSLNAFNGQSFRMLSTGGLLEDDYDLMLDPARIPLIKGGRTYTNLSDILNGWLQNSYLLGGNTKLATIYLAGLYDRSSTRTPQYTNLQDRYGNPLTGDAEIYNTVLEDRDGNGNYDWEELSHLMESAWWENAFSDMYLGIGGYLGKNRIGFGFIANNTTGRIIASAQNYNYTNTHLSLITQEIVYSDSSQGTGTMDFSNHSKNYFLSFWMPVVRNLDMGFQLGMNPFNTGNTFQDTSFLMQDWSPEDISTIDTHTEHSRDFTDFPQHSNDLYFSAKTIYNSGKKEIWGVITMSHTGIGIKDNIEHHFNSVVDSTTVGPGIQITLDTTDTIAMSNGSGSNNEISFFGKIIHRPSDKVRFAMGINLVSGNGSITTTTNDNYEAFHLYQDGDTASLDHDDFTRVTTSSDSITNITTYNYSQISLPVGFEWAVKPEVLLRAGANYRYYYRNQTTTSTLDSVSVQHTRTDYGDGTYTESIITPNNENKGSSETKITKTPKTNYYFGVGFIPLPSFQIDVTMTTTFIFNASLTYKF